MEGVTHKDDKKIRIHISVTKIRHGYYEPGSFIDICE